MYTAHSTRHAATSAASRRGLSVDAIHRAAGWGQHSHVFATFYNREVAPASTDFARAVFEV